MSNVPMTLPELAISIQYRPYGHTSTYAQLDDGRLLHVSHHVYEHSEDGGLTWSENQLMKDINGDQVGSSETSLVKLSGHNEVGLCARVSETPQPSSPEGYALPPLHIEFFFWRSTDGGETWKPPVRMSPPGLSTAGYQDSMLRTSSGRIVVPVFISMGQSSGPDDCIAPCSGRLVHNQFVGTGGHYFDPQYSCNYVLYSDDEGRSWQMNKDGALMILRDWNAIFSYSNEASVTEVKPDRLMMIMRNPLGRLFQAWSNDNGETWTRPQPTVLAAPTAPGQIRTLSNGHLLCVWNQQGPDEIRGGYNRTRVSSAISRDGGRVWEFFQNLHSIHETTRVEPGPIEPIRPEEISFPSGQPATERDPKYIQPHDGFFSTCSYPSVHVMKDRVLVALPCCLYKQHETEARHVRDVSEGGYVDPKNGKTMCQKFMILPYKWFYGGKEPADNPFLREAYEPAKP